MSGVMKKVHYFHFRPYGDIVSNRGTDKQETIEGPLARGGATVCYLPIDDGAVFGLSVCSSRDGFWRKEGRNKSLGDAMTRVHPHELFPMMDMDAAIEVAKDLVQKAAKRIGERKLIELKTRYQEELFKIVTEQDRLHNSKLVSRKNRQKA